MKNIKGNKFTAAAFLVFTLIICLFSTFKFRSMVKKEEIFPSSGLSTKRTMSFYFPRLKNTAGDSEVYIFEGKEEGGALLILGGTHANEPAGFITALLLVENIKVAKGKVIIIPRANNSGFTHSDPQEGNPQRYSLETPGGERWFRYGSRLTNPIHQWPDPTLYLNPAEQKLSGTETRNLNRCYPGRKTGYLTERIAYAVMELIRKEKIDIGIDLHEAAPEYPVINAIVFHENSAELAALSYMELQFEGFEFRLESSPPNLRGLNHREWGDHAQIKAILLETANVSHGRLKGKTSEELIVEGKDKNYVKAGKLGRLFVPFGEEGIPLKQRVARHLAALETIVSSFNETEKESIVILNIPSHLGVSERGIGFFLKPPNKR